MNTEIKAGIHNRFDIEVIDARTGEVHQRAKAYNIICNSLWNRLFSSTHAPYFNYIVYGSGSGTPSASDTALFQYAGNKAVNDESINYDTVNHVKSFTRSIVLGVSDAVGVTLSEVGIGYDGTHIVTHAMLQDMNGNPVTITKTDTDIVNIHATVFVHSQISYSGMSVDISDSSTGRFYSGLSTWLAGFNLKQYGTLGDGDNVPCNAVTATREYPVQHGPNLSGIEHLMCSVSVNAADRTLISTVRFGVDSFNIDGGIKYICINSRIGTGAGGLAYLKPTVIIPIGTAQGFPGYQITGDSIGTGDGSETAFQTHFDVARDFVLKVNGTAVSNFTRDGRNITFTAAPEIGAVVTADYFTDTIPKDENHVYDLTVTISFGEYTPE